MLGLVPLHSHHPASVGPQSGRAICPHPQSPPFPPGWFSLQSPSFPQHLSCHPEWMTSLPLNRPKATQAEPPPLPPHPQVPRIHCELAATQRSGRSSHCGHPQLLDLLSQPAGPPAATGAEMPHCHLPACLAGGPERVSLSSSMGHVGSLQGPCRKGLSS